MWLPHISGCCSHGSQGEEEECGERGFVRWLWRKDCRMKICSASTNQVELEKPTLFNLLNCRRVGVLALW